MKKIALFLFCAFISGYVIANPGNEPVTKAVGFTYIKSMQSDAQLNEYLIKNWLAMDKTAVAQGLFQDYQLVANGSDDNDWDFVMIVTYNDTTGYQGIAKEFEKIRASHTEVTVDGMAFNKLGKIVNVEYHEQWY